MPSAELQNPSIRTLDLRKYRFLLKFPFYIIAVVSFYLIIIYKSSETSDFRMNRFLMKSPLGVLTTVTIYLTTIHMGPKLMKYREPFSLTTIIILYNFVQIVFNVTHFLQTLLIMKSVNILCTPPNTSDSEIDLTVQQLHYWYFLLKYFDLIETGFFILRKKERQISFLHVYHHVGIMMSTWISGMYFPGGQGLFTGFYNTATHAVMYCYYMASLVGRNSDGLLWWKKYVTALQIIQHFLIFVSMFPAVVNVNCSYPKVESAIYLLSVLHILYLFVEFYKNAYLRKTK